MLLSAVTFCNERWGGGWVLRTKPRLVAVYAVVIGLHLPPFRDLYKGPSPLPVRTLLNSYQMHYQYLYVPMVSSPVRESLAGVAKK